ASSTTETPPSPFSRAASRATERWGSASMMVGWWPPRCQYTPRQLARVLFPLPPFMVATVMIELVTVRPPGNAMRRINHEYAITHGNASSQQLAPFVARGGGLPRPARVITAGYGRGERSIEAAAMGLMQRFGLSRDPTEAALEARVSALQTALGKCKEVATRWTRRRREIVAGTAGGGVVLGVTRRGGRRAGHQQSSPPRPQKGGGGWGAAGRGRLSERELRGRGAGGATAGGIGRCSCPVPAREDVLARPRRAARRG